MAKLHSYFVLCPLIDQKSFVGVSEDKDAEFVIVTLSRNVVNKYRLSDQKQVGGWTSKEHITSNVIFDKAEDTYVGVFNKNTIKIWQEDCENLDKLKKYKFPINISKILTRKNQTPLIIFENGNCASLPYALENRKTYENMSLLKDSETMVNTSSYKLNNVNYICYIVKDSKDRFEIITSPTREELGDMEKSKIIKTKISRSDDVYVIGKLISPFDRPAVYVLWSDSKMTMYDLAKKSWRTIGSVPWISTSTTVSMSWMGKNHLILFGSNIEQDGAIIVAYNILLGVGSCRYPMKMYAEDAKLYCFNDRIILEASNHIGMLPYMLETKRNLSSLLGSHDVVPEEHTEIADWDTPTKPLFTINNDTRDLLKLGLTERSICSQIIVPLLEKSDHRNILGVLKEFKDVPESILVQLLNYVLKSIGSNGIDASCFEDFVKWFDMLVKSDKEGKVELLNYLFEVSFSDALLITYLRELLTLDDTLFLLTYISFLFVNVENTITMDFESKLFDWCILLMDAFYQQFLMTKDEKVSKVLENTMNIIQSLVGQLNSIDKVLPILNKFVDGKVTTDDNDDLLPYTIEMMQI